MRINRQVVVFDAADLASESTFWAGVLDGTVDAEDDWHMVMVDGEPRVGVQLAPNHIQPDWPEGTPEQQIHLDLWVDDFADAHNRVVSLGAKVLKPAVRTQTPPTTSRSTRILPGIRSACAGFNDASSSRPAGPGSHQPISNTHVSVPTAGSAGTASTGPLAAAAMAASSCSMLIE
jgi:hypothetical protein